MSVTFTPPIDLPLLRAELAAASIVVSALGTHENVVHTYDATGTALDLPPDAQPVVDAHQPPPPIVGYAGATPVAQRVRTTDDQPHEVMRITTAAKHVYRATLRVAGIDAVSGTTRDSEVRMVFKGLAASVVQVGATAVLSNMQDTAAASWRITPTVEGPDLVFSVQGALGRSVDWLMTGEIGSFCPEGLA